jgi:hypothetical protein
MCIQGEGWRIQAERRGLLRREASEVDPARLSLFPLQSFVPDKHAIGILEKEDRGMA